VDGQDDGGEDSEHLAAMHRSIGYRYLAEGERMSGNWLGPGMTGWRGGHMRWMHDGWWAGQWGVWGWLGLILMIAFWILVIAGIVLLVRWLIRQGHGSGGGGGSESALDVLERRYAKGEISAEEYRRMKREISDEDPS
jgi:putative membrane protein